MVHLTPKYFVGLDLGQTTDFTALGVLERPSLESGDDPDPVYSLRHLQRFPLGTPYPQIVREVVTMLQTSILVGAWLVIDQTGVGRPVVDLFREALPKPMQTRFEPITISGGHEVHRREGGLVVPKKELIASLQVVLQTHRLRIARSLPDAELLLREMEQFKVEITPAGNETFEAWRAGIHDDLVLAVSLATWYAERTLPAERSRFSRQRPHMIDVRLSPFSNS